MKGKESFPTSRHQQLCLQYCNATNSFSCISRPNVLEQLDICAYQGYGPGNSCNWIHCRAKLKNFLYRIGSNLACSTSRRYCQGHIEDFGTVPDFCAYRCCAVLKAIRISSWTCSCHCIFWPAALHILSDKEHFSIFRLGTSRPWLRPRVLVSNWRFLIVLFALCFLKLM